MAGASASEMFLFIGAIIAAAALSGVVVTVGADYASAIETRAEDQVTGLQEEIEIINDPAAVATNDLVLYVQNTGQTVIDLAPWIIILDGQVQSNTVADVLDASDDSRIFPGQVVEWTITVTTSGGDHHLQVVTGHGTKANFSFFEP